MEIEFEDEGTKLYFTGIWIPREVIILAANRKISWTEALFLGVVKAMSKPGGPGCWARNASLARFFNMTPRGIQKIVSHLREVELLEYFYDGDRRYIKVRFPESAEVPPTNSCSPHERRDMGRLLLRNRLDNKQRPRVRGSQVLDSDKEGKTVATFKPLPSKEKSTALHFDLATILHDTIVHARKITRPWSKTQWAASFRLLEKDLNGDAIRLRRILEWWSKNPKMRGLPTIINAAQFRKHFAWIEEVAEREIGKHVDVGDEAKTIEKRVRMKGWPGKASEQLPAAIQLSLNNLRNILNDLKEVLDNMSERERSFLLFVKHFRSKVGDPRHYVETWMNQIHVQFCSWKEWNQDLMAQVLTLEHQRFTKWGRNLAAGFAADVRLWDRLVKEINQCR